MHALALPALHRLSSVAPVILRVLVGIVMTAHGWQKLTAMGPATFGSEMLGGLGVPLPVAFGWIVTFVELLGGIALIIGLFSRVAALALAGIMVGAILLVKIDLGLIAAPDAPLPGAELDLVLLAGMLGVALLGPGRPSVDHMIGIEQDQSSAGNAVTSY
ncbi:DoxX family protein [soil metagenome]